MKLGRWALGSALLALVCFGCESGSETELRAGSGQHYDAVTVFRAIYFNDGAAAKAVQSWRLPRKDAPAAKTRALSPAIVAEQVRSVADQYGAEGLKATSTRMRALADAIEKTELPTVVGSSEHEEESKRLLLVRIKKADPKFFTRFAAAVRSGKHVLVEKALSEGMARLAAVASEVAAPEMPTSGFAAPEEDDFQSFGGYGNEDDGEDDGLDVGDEDAQDDGGDDTNPTLAGGGKGAPPKGGGSGGGNKGTPPKTGGGSGGGKGTPPKGGGSGGSKGKPPKTGPGIPGDQSGFINGLFTNVTAYNDTALAINRVVAASVTVYVGGDGERSLRSAGYVDHLTRTFEE